MMTITEQLAAEPHVVIRLKDNPDEGAARWPALGCGLNGYTVSLPREQKMVVSKPLVNILHESSESNGEIIIQEFGTLSPSEVAQMRKVPMAQREMPIFPGSVKPSGLRVPTEKKKKEDK